MEGHNMYGMTNEDHRAHTVAGLHKLADFLYEYDDSARLNTASRIDIQYSVLEEDNDAARAEFADAAEFLREVRRDWTAEFSEEHNVYDTNTHHIAMLTFGAGTVAYRVVWIEKTGDTEDE
jgi:hypothetical protein